MKKTYVFCSLAISMSLIACGGSDQVKRADQAEYEVVQEGASGGATSTALTDGTAAPMAMTGTNADTTTAFTLPTVTGAPADPNAAPGTIASSLPANVYDGSSPAPRPRVAQSAPRPEPRETVEPQPAPAAPPMTSAAPEPAPETEKKTETKEEPAPEPAPATDTATQTDTQPPGL